MWTWETIFYTHCFYRGLRISPKIKTQRSTGISGKETKDDEPEPNSDAMERSSFRMRSSLSLFFAARSACWRAANRQAWAAVWQSHYHRMDPDARGLQFAASTSESISFPTKSGVAYPIPSPKWQLEVEACLGSLRRQGQASGLTGSDRNAQLPVSTHDPRAQGLCLPGGGEHGGSALLKERTPCIDLLWLV